MTEATRTAGRRRSDAVTGKVMAAAREAFGTKGFTTVTMSDIASSAGVGLDSIYRRWSSKQALLVDLVAAAVVTDVQVPDTGRLTTDLEQLLTSLARAVDSDFGALLATAVAECAHEPELASRLAQAQVARRDMTLVVITRAIERGELPEDCDAHLLLDLLAGLVWQRAWLRRMPLTQAQARLAVGQLVAAATSEGVRP
jgi:AcrR family transcriptional regulator